MNQYSWITLLLFVATLAACTAPTPPQPSVAASPSVAPSSPLTIIKPTGKLSSRLEMLANSPSLRAASPEEQARALSLPPQGAGSLNRDAQGRVLVSIRMVDIAPNQLQELRDAGAMITNVAEQYRTVSAFVALNDLNAIANLAAVQNVQEELTPGTRGVVAPPTP